MSTDEGWKARKERRAAVNCGSDQPLPSVVRQLRWGWLIALPLALFVFLIGNSVGQAQGGKVFLFSMCAAFAALSYWLWRPFNYFSDHPWLGKSFEQLSTGELKALSYLNKRSGKIVAICAAGLAAAVPTAGAVARALGIVIAPHANIPVLVAAAGSGILALLLYTTLIMNLLRRRWGWIIENESLLHPRLMIWYAKGRELPDFQGHRLGEESRDDHTPWNMSAREVVHLVFSLGGTGLVLLGLARLVFTPETVMAGAHSHRATVVLIIGIVVAALGGLLKPRKH